MRGLIHTLAALALTAALAGCSLFSSSGAGSQKPSPRQDAVLGYLDSGRPKAALVEADQLVAEAPDDYQSYLTRNAVQLVLRDNEAAQADNAKALQVFEANQGRYPEKERNYRLAKIHESMALTALVASRRATDPAARASLEAQYREHADTVRQLDEDTWKNLRGLAGESVPE